MATWAEVRRVPNADYGYVSSITTGGSVPEGSTPNVWFLDLALYDPDPVVGDYYDPGTDSFSSAPPTPLPAPDTNALDLWFERFTATERAKTWAVCNGETPPGVTINLEQRYRTAAFRDVTLSGLSFPLDEAECVAVVNGLESAGVLAAGRAAEILDY